MGSWYAFRRLPPADGARLRGPIMAVTREPLPPGVAKLTGTDFRRLRVGGLRLVCLVDEAARLVVILRVARRAESTYRAQRRLEP